MKILTFNKQTNKKYVIAGFMLILCVFLSGCSKNLFSNSDFSETAASDTISKTNVSENSESPDYEKLISNMTLEEKIGQMFYVRCPVDDETALEYLTKYHLGGYILFYENVKEKSKEELSSEIQSYQNGAEYPLLIGVDEEGGTVNRVSLNPELRETEFLSPKDIFAKDGWDGITADAEEKADLLLSLGINVNMAPVCDLSSDANAFMYERSFSSDFEETSQFVRYEVIVSKSKKLGTVLKHFPGYGNNGDTHEGIVYDNREYSEFEQNDFKPFIAGADAGADCILVSHNIVSCMDSEMPASLSENVHKIIRDELGFDGVIMTDDLIMSAITKFTDGQAAAVAAAKCGNDILCCSDIETQYPAVLEAVQNDEISEEQINQSVKRILIWKHNLGLI